MADRFTLHRAAGARAESRRQVERTRAGVTRLVELTTSLATRMETLPVTSVQAARDRQLRVALLRDVADAGRRSLAAAAPRTNEAGGGAAG